ncbi:MAG: hypothetical protein H7840_02030 [Alphaproteobacteria bacterium]
MSVTVKTFGIIAIALVGLLAYFSTFLLGFHAMFYLALGLTPTFLVLLMVLTAGRMDEA